MIMSFPAVIPGRAEGANPESIRRSRDYRFRAPAFGRPRNDELTGSGQ
jgi:hypothetical protein